MEKIKHIDVLGLWGRMDLHWELQDGINILAGGNGSGKSTVLRCLSDMFRKGAIATERAALMRELRVTFVDNTSVSSNERFDSKHYNVDVISTFDMSSSSRSNNPSQGVGIETLDSDLDWELFRLEKRYLRYQLEIGRQVIDALTRGESSAVIAQITGHKALFCDMIDDLFGHTGKRLVRGSDSLMFSFEDGTTISPWQLSSGEKQMVIILTTVLVENRKPSVLIMDEPEISLHFDWQKRLLDDIMQLNPQVQVIVATHSPALVMRGWVDRVTEISELSR